MNIYGFFMRICLIDVQEKQLIVSSAMVAHPNERTNKVCS